MRQSAHATISRKNKFERSCFRFPRNTTYVSRLDAARVTPRKLLSIQRVTTTRFNIACNALRYCYFGVNTRAPRISQSRVYLLPRVVTEPACAPSIFSLAHYLLLSVDRAVLLSVRSCSGTSYLLTMVGRPEDTDPHCFTIEPFRCRNAAKASASSPRIAARPVAGSGVATKLAE